jgi:DNA-binding PadR family transcriptional regulator
MSLRHGLLGLLNYQPMTGYDLNKEFNGSLGHFWQAKTSQIYRELDSMERNGWLTSERVIQDDKPNKRVYSITEQGKAEFLSWLSSLDALKDALQMRSSFLMRVFFGAELNAERTVELFESLKEIAAQTSTQLQSVIAELDAITPDAGETFTQAKYWKITALCGEIMNNANVQWADESIKILKEEQSK